VLCGVVLRRESVYEMRKRENECKSLNKWVNEFGFGFGS